MSRVRDEAAEQLGPRSPARPAAPQGQGGFLHYWPLIVNFARRDLQARFKGTVFGAVWSLLTPLATLVTYSIVFGIIFRGEPPLLGNGDKAPFFLFLFSGLVPWGMYSVTVSTSIGSLLGNGPLMKKIYFPAYTSVFGSLLATFYQSLIELGLLLVVLVAMANVSVTWLLLVGWAALLAVFAGSVALTLAVLNVHYRDTGHLVGIAIQLQFYLTPVIFPISLVPGVWHGLPLRSIVEYQPMAAFVEAFRSLVYDLSVGPARAWLTCLAWTALAVLVASAVYRRKGLDLSEEM